MRGLAGRRVVARCEDGKMMDGIIHRFEERTYGKLVTRSLHFRMDPDRNPRTAIGQNWNRKLVQREVSSMTPLTGPWEWGPAVGPVECEFPEDDPHPTRRPR